MVNVQDICQDTVADISCNTSQNLLCFTNISMYTGPLQTTVQIFVMHSNQMINNFGEL